MNYWLLRYCCVALTLAALMLGTCLLPLQSGVQAQQGDDTEQVVTAGSTVFALATRPSLGTQPQRLVSFDVSSPDTLRSDIIIQGLQSGETLKGIDFRPSDGQLYALGSSSRIYRLNFVTGVATQVGSSAFTPAISPTDFFGFDFNPVPDAIRVIAAVSDQSLRINPNTGAVAATDTSVAYATSDANAGNLPNIVGAAYTNNFVGTTATTLYGIDARPEGTARLVTVGGLNSSPSPNGGQLSTVANVTTLAGATIQTNNLVGFDVASDGAAYLSLTPINPFDAPSSFYTLNLTTGRANFISAIGTDNTTSGGLRIEGIAVAVATGATNPNNNTFQINPTTYTVSEGAGSVNVTVTRTGATTSAATVRYATVDGTATQTMDYITAAGILFFGAGETSKVVTVLITDDVFMESSETLSFVLSTPDGGTIATAGRTATITITDNDATTPTANPIDDVSFFVRQQYRDFLSREPDAAGFTFWTGEYNRRVNACGSIANAAQRQGCIFTARAGISLAFFLSVEFQQTGYLVYRTYDVAFARVGTPRPDRGQTISQVAVSYDEFFRDTQTIARNIVVNNAISQAQLTANTQDFYREFVQRETFTARYPIGQSATEYVDALFASAGLTPTTAERQAALTAYGSGGTQGRADALQAIAELDRIFQRDFNRAFVLLQYFGYLRRNPDIAGYNFWLAKLDAASTSTTINRMNVPNDEEAIGRIRRSQMVEAFIRSCEYQRRFGPATTSPDDRPVATACSAL